ncbi:MAG: aspartate carbamoyltransferase catalytic subunit [Candidatus Omnitrophica bacterium]|nr:aspartate carbamoyltransferase catalytic subunit [Candidatus Omnitrophota bacterium]
MNQKQWNKKDLLGLEDLSREEIELILDNAQSFKEISQREVKKVPALRGKTIALLFFEPSTRTRASFELAAKRLSADTISISSSTSSILKGESLLDSVKNIEAMSVDLVIIRDASAGLPWQVASRIAAGVINAGDGCHEHPTQALLDLFTIREKKGKIEGLKVSIVGDIAHSRVARSNIYGLKKLGAEVTVCGPSTLIPLKIEKMGVKVVYDIDEAIREADVLNVLRIQKERYSIDSQIPSLREYRRQFGITRERLRRASKDILIMHPGPINRGLELDSEIADVRSVVLEQVTNGLAVRMAVIYLLTGSLMKQTSLT